MKTPKTFSFKKNTDIAALPDAKPHKEETTRVPIKAPKGRVGRKPTSAEGARTKQVSAYLTDKEWARFDEALDGRPASVKVRQLILEYIGK